jgi:LmbE family N-acetylglucosaminyl deacetylase
VTVLVVAAHPDDEALGCGGTIARHAADGDDVIVAFLADGVTSRAPGADHSAGISRRQGAARSAASILGVRDVRFGDLPDNRLDTLPLLAIAQAVEAVIAEVVPTTIYTHFAHDLNVDHRLVHEAVMTAVRPQPGSAVTTVLTFETPSSTEWRAPQAATAFAPDWFVDITDTLDLKLQALDAYAEEMRPWPHPRSREAVAHLAHWRGSTIGRVAAEAFVLARHIA